MAPGIKFEVVALVLAVAAAIVERSTGATYVVGDASGWTIPTAGTPTYSSWAARHTFLPGDMLVFNFTTGVHDITKVNKAGFDSCTSTASAISLSVSPATVTLTSAGSQYFICTQHCSLGQKLAVKVSAAAPTTPPMSLPTSPPAPAPISTAIPTTIASSPAPAVPPVATTVPTFPSSGGPPAPEVPEAPLSPLSEGVPSDGDRFPGIGIGSGSDPISPPSFASSATSSTLLCMITSFAAVVIHMLH